MLLLEVLVANFLEKLVLVRDVLEVLVFVLVADMLEVEHAFALVVVPVRLRSDVVLVLVKDSTCAGAVD